MKKLMFVLSVLFMSVMAHAQTDGKSKMAMKDHSCTAACKDGKHMYAHGEKGHTCGKECKSMGSTMKEHTCTPACKDGKHMYAHGEKGHTCTADCKKM
ncbi:MAG: hypothetical protein ACHQRM_00770 [Bacteroidia bacterium]